MTQQINTSKSSQSFRSVTHDSLKKITAVTLLLTMLYQITAAQQLYKEDKQLSAKLDQMIGDRFKPNGIGCVVLVARKGQVVYKKAFGMADLELHVPMKLDHVFRIASLTKQFTAVAILQLVEKGSLNLKDDIRKFIPDYPVDNDTITIENLLSHTSGIKNLTEIESSREEISYKTPEDLIKIFKDQPKDFRAGTNFRYSNSGYVLLGYIIEKITGKSYAQYISENIFRPLLMKNSYFDRADTIISNRLKGYLEISDSKARNAEYMFASDAYAAGALAMTVEDFFKWHIATRENKILKKESLQKATTPFTLKNGEKTTYGFGWDLRPYLGSPTTHHGGGISGFSSFEVYLPEEDIFVAIFSNGANKNTMGPAFFAVSLAANKSNIREIDPGQALIDKYVGTYKFSADDPATITIFKQNGKLFLKDNRFPKPWQMRFTTSASFYCYEVFPNNHVFNLDSSGKVQGFNIEINDMRATLIKM